MAVPSVLPATPSHFMAASQSPFGVGDWAAQTTSTPSLLPNPKTTSSTPRKPKLSLNTSCARPIVARPSGLRLDVLSAVSPTVRNTFKNVLDDGHDSRSPRSIPLPYSPKASSARSPRLECPAFTMEKAQSPSTKQPSSKSHHKSHSTSSPRTEFPSLTVKDSASQHLSVAYMQPCNLRSILANPPCLKRSLAIRSPLTPSSNTVPSRSPLSPLKKRVCFRSPLVEDIVTSKYILKHSDIISRSPSPALPQNDAPDSSDHISLATDDKPGHSKPIKEGTYLSEPHAASPQSSMQELENDSDESDHIPVTNTPVAGRSKRERDWYWTLGPLPGMTNSTPDEDILQDIEKTNTYPHFTNYSVKTSSSRVQIVCTETQPSKVEGLDHGEYYTTSGFDSTPS